MINYIINRKTLAVTALNEKQSLVYEAGRQLVIERNTLHIVRKSCQVFGSTYRGRTEGTKKITGYRYKMPIVVQDYDGIVIFPTQSPTAPINDWISLQHVEHFYPNLAKNTTFVRFDNGLLLEFGISFPSFQSQYMKACYLSTIIKRNK